MKLIWLDQSVQGSKVTYVILVYLRSKVSQVGQNGSVRVGQQVSQVDQLSQENQVSWVRQLGKVNYSAYIRLGQLHLLGQASKLLMFDQLGKVN